MIDWINQSHTMNGTSFKLHTEVLLGYVLSMNGLGSVEDGESEETIDTTQVPSSPKPKPAVQQTKKTATPTESTPIELIPITVEDVPAPSPLEDIPTSSENDKTLK